MYISRVKVWNFRRFGTSDPVNAKLDSPDLDVTLTKGLNALIGPNDSGKTAVIDAIKLLLGIHSTEWNWFTDDDFYQLSQHIRLECVIEGFTVNEGKNFTEWSSFDQNGYQKLTIRIDAYKQPKGIMGDVRAGEDEGSLLPAEARTRLKAVYLKPLRDAQNELIARKNSRLSQILKGHHLFKDESTPGSVALKSHVNTANSNIGKYFQKGGDGYTHVTEILESPLKDFFDDDTAGVIDAGDTQTIKNVLEKLSLRIDNLQNPGLGSLNRLFIAIELLLFLSNTNDDGAAHFVLIEELEAHLHPQAQLKVAKYLQNKCDDGNAQIIISTHSPVLASKIKLQNLIIFTQDISNGIGCYSLASGNTRLETTDYRFLERFLDSTKANLFFARGVIVVEGDAENLLLPTIARKINRDLTDYGVSIVNVGSTAYLRYVKIFQRPNGNSIPIKTSAITDLDIPPLNYKAVKSDVKTEAEMDSTELDSYRKEKVKFEDDENIKSFVSPHWTLEYCLALAPRLRKLLLKAALLAKEEKLSDVTPTRRASSDTEIDAEVNAFFSSHTQRNSSNEDIAFDIYYNNIVLPQVSKAVVAQQLASLIEDSSTIDLSDISISYLLEAIYHATIKAEED